MKHGFREGVFLFLRPSDVRLGTLAQEWTLSPLLTNASGAPVDWERKAELSVADVRSLTRERPRGSVRNISTEGLRDVRKVFLSLSFKDIAQQDEAREAFKAVFAEKGIAVLLGNVAGAAMIDEISQQIYDSDFTLADITHLSANIALELGLTYGLGHRVYPIAEANSKGELPLRPLAFLLNLGVLRYSLEGEQLRKVRDTLLGKARQSVSPSHLLVQSFTRRVKLRVKESGKCLCVYYPKARSGVWQRNIGNIQALARDRGFACLVPQLSPHRGNLPILENLLWCISKSDRVLVDTTGEKEPDELGAFGLGYATGLNQVGSKKDIRRLEEAGRELPGSLVMWPEGQFKMWTDGADLIHYVSGLLA